jgi:Protein of unknown function (DUF3617)
MSLNSRNILAALALAVSAFAAQAQVSKAGLWEVTTKLGGSAEMDQAMAQMQQQMANMPPEQRKQMEAMLAKQGMSMTSTPGGMLSKMCITKDMVDRGQMPVQTQGDCTSTTSNKSSTGMTVKFTCASPPSSGEGQYTFMGDSAYTMKMKINTQQQGKPAVTTMDSSGKWLGADCGNIKPMVIPK